MDKPNLLFIFSDQHRLRSLGRYTSDIISPNFDAFADSAANFTSCISNCPVCVPIRGSILTGLYSWKHRAITNDLPIDTSTRSIADVMNENGYHTGYIGKWHLGGIPRDKFIPENERLGFTEWKVANCNHTYDKGYYFDENNIRHEFDKFESVGQTDLAIDFIKRGKEKEKPWALTLSWGPPHAPFNAVPKEYLDLYDPAKLELPPNVPEDRRSMLALDKWLNEDELRSWLRGYYAFITLLDDQFKRLLDSLEETGQLENTIIVYTSDHGDMLGSQAMNKKQLPYNESVKVPLMVRWAGHTVPVESNELISLTDLPVSLVGLMGLDFCTETDGQDLHHLFVDENAKGPDYTLIYELIPCHQAESRGGREWIGFYDKNYAYAVHSNFSDYIIYDNQKDPEQLHNLANTTPELSASLQNKLKKILDNLGLDFRRWENFVIEDGLLDIWNKSQRHFNRIELDPENLPPFIIRN